MVAPPRIIVPPRRCIAQEKYIPNTTNKKPLRPQTKQKLPLRMAKITFSRGHLKGNCTLTSKIFVIAKNSSDFQSKGN